MAEMLLWSDEYSVKIVKIDEQHKKLLDVINKLNEGLTVGQSRTDLQKIFGGLLDYVHNHFATEEDFMEKHNFPGTEEHRQEHDEFRRKLVKFLDAFLEANEDIAMEMAIYLRSWLKTHVFLTDKKYSVFLNERGVF